MSAPSLRWQLSKVGLVVAATVLALSMLSMVALERLGGAIGLILRENYASVVACQDMDEALARQDHGAQLTASGRDEMGRTIITAHRRAFEAALHFEAQNLTLPGEGQLVASLDAGYRDYVRAVDAALSSPLEGRSARYFAELHPKLLGLEEQVRAIRLLNQRNMERADGEARRVAQRTLRVAMVATVIALLLTGWLALRFPRTVVEPILVFTERARAIGEGRFDHQLALPDVDELRGLAEALNRMQDKLRAYRESSLGALLAAKDLSRATVASMTDPVLVFGDQEILLVNEAAHRIFGLSPGDPKGVPEAITVARDRVLAQQAPLAPGSLSEAMLWSYGDRELYFLVRGSPLRTEDEGDARGVLIVAEDVTRYRRIDALKSDAVATVSHELKTPLTSLRLATEMLLDQAAGQTAVQRELARTARDQTERLQRMVDELLDLVRIEREAGAPHPRSVDVLAMLGDVLDTHAAAARERQVEIVIECESGTTALLDLGQIKILLGNLLSNAVRHSRPAGKVVLSARREPLALVLAVVDQGEGMKEERLPGIFVRSRPSGVPGRHGLGLAIAGEIAERHGGVLRVESALGAGTTFELRLPA